MSALIYIVTETTSYDYEGSNTQVIFSTFDKDEAITFAQEHLICNIALATLYGQHLSTCVDSNEIGVPNSSECVWISIQNKKSELPLTKVLLNKLKQAPINTLYYQNTIKPSLGWALGSTELLVGERVISSVDILAIESYADSLIHLDDEELAELAIAKLGTEFSKMCAELSLNTQDWALFDSFEAHYM